MDNAWGFPGTSVALPDGVPEQRRPLLTPVAAHGGSEGEKEDRVWEQMNQLVLVAQQLRPNGSIEFSADYRPVPPHVLWQWVP